MGIQCTRCTPECVCKKEDATLVRRARPFCRSRRQHEYVPRAFPNSVGPRTDQVGQTDTTSHVDEVLSSRTQRVSIIGRGGMIALAPKFPRGLCPAATMLSFLRLSLQATSAQYSRRRLPHSLGVEVASIALSFALDLEVARAFNGGQVQLLHPQ